MKKVIIVFVLLLFALFIVFSKGPSDFDELKQKYTDEHSHFMKVGDLNVHYKMKGEGMPILLIHGTSSSLHTWESWEDILSKQYKTISIDMQGGGLTTPPADDDYSIQAYIDLIDAMVNELNIDSFYMAGNSLGGHIAWEYAVHAKNAAKVKKLILVDPSGFFVEGAERPFVFKMAESDLLHSMIEGINTGMFVKKSLKEVYYNDELVTDELVQRYKDLTSREGNRNAFFHKVKQIEMGDANDLTKISCPTLIQWGREDIWIPLELSEIFAENIPNNRLVIYDNCGHVPMEEMPEASAKDVLDFLVD